MARTSHLNLTGRAASEDLAEFRNSLFEDAERREREARLNALLEQEADVIVQCIEIEGEPAFWDWYNHNTDIPDHGSTLHRIEVVTAHLESLRIPSREVAHAYLAKKQAKITPTAEQESDALQDLFSAHWDEIPEIEF